jgi:predicted PurR-regulated permease PerM
MKSKTGAPPVVVSVVALAAVFIVLLGMRAANEILAPVILALVFAICATPLLSWFTDRGAPPWLALILTIALAIVFIVGIVWLVGVSVQDFSATMSAYDQRFMEMQQMLGGALSKLGVDVQTLGADPLTAPEGLVELAAGFVGSLVAGLSNWATILLTTVFFLVEALALPRKLQSVAPKDDPGVQRFLGLARQLREYMVINAGVGLLAAVLNTILLTLLGVEFAALWGLLSFFFSFVPNIGFVISVIPPAIMALVQFGLPQTAVVIVAYVVINFLIDTVIKPRFIEEGVNISATVTFLSLIVWAWVLGPMGAILAVPMSIILQTVLNSREETRWLAYLMGTGSEPFKPGTEPDQDTEGGELAPETET